MRGRSRPSPRHGRSRSRTRRDPDLHPHGRVDHVAQHFLDEVLVLIAHDVRLDLGGSTQPDQTVVSAEFQEGKRFYPRLVGLFGHACRDGGTARVPLFLHGGRRLRASLGKASGCFL